MSHPIDLNAIKLNEIRMQNSFEDFYFIGECLQCLMILHWNLTHHKHMQIHTCNNNNNNNDDDIYSAVIMTEVIARVHSVHQVNVEQRQAAADPQTKPPDGL